MTLTRIILLLVGALVIMLSVVILRAEATRIHHQIALLERQDEILRQQLRWEQAVLQRERRPTALLDRIKDVRPLEP